MNTLRILGSLLIAVPLLAGLIHLMVYELTPMGAAIVASVLVGVLLVLLSVI